MGVDPSHTTEILGRADAEKGMPWVNLAEGCQNPTGGGTPTPDRRRQDDDDDDACGLHRKPHGARKRRRRRNKELKKKEKKTESGRRKDGAGVRKEEGGGEEGEARLLDWSPLLVQRGSQDEWKPTEAQTGGASLVRGRRRSPRRCFVASTSTCERRPTHRRRTSKRCTRRGKGKAWNAAKERLGRSPGRAQSRGQGPRGSRQASWQR